MPRRVSFWPLDSLGSLEKMLMVLDYRTSRVTKSVKMHPNTYTFTDLMTQAREATPFATLKP